MISRMIRRFFPMVAEGHNEMEGMRRVGPVFLRLTETWDDSGDDTGESYHLSVRWDTGSLRTEIRVLAATVLQRAVHRIAGSADWRTEQEQEQEIRHLAGAIRYFA